MLISKSIGARVVKLALLMMAASAVIAAEPVSFTSFDIPGATNYFVAGINDEGLVAGSWFATDGSEVGFIRLPDGRISTPIVDPNDNSRTTTLRAINDEGVIAGFYGASADSGFLLTEGEFRTVDFPGAVSTLLRGINNLGDLSGTYSIVDLNADEFGFIIPRRGPAISFKLADPTGTGIVVGGINDLRQLVGYYTDATSTLVGFLRQPSGQFVSYYLSRGAQHPSRWHQRLWNCGRGLGRRKHGTRVLRPPWEPAQLRCARSGCKLCAGNKQRGPSSRALCHA
jgi:hypothetical protein